MNETKHNTKWCRIRAAYHKALRKKKRHKLLPTWCLFVGCFASISPIPNKRKQTQIRGDDQGKRQQSWITDSETKTVPKKNYKRCRKRMPTRTHHRDQLLHTNVDCRNRNSMQTNIIQLGTRQREKEGKKKDGRFRSLHSSVIVFVSFPVSISHGDLIHIREQSTAHGVSGRPRK